MDETERNIWEHGSKHWDMSREHRLLLSALVESLLFPEWMK